MKKGITKYCRVRIIVGGREARRGKGKRKKNCKTMVRLDREGRNKM